MATSPNGPQHVGGEDMEQDQSDDTPPWHSRTQFVEYEKVMGMIDDLPNSCEQPHLMEVAKEQLVYIMDQYLEQPQLLDPHLDNILGKLIGIARDPKAPVPLKHEAFKFVYIFVKVRGYKVVVRHLPHEASDLEPVLEMLEVQDQSVYLTWETRYVLLLWMSIIIMIPFPLESLDRDCGKSTSISERMKDVCQEYICVGDKAQDAAAYLYARFLCRQDVQQTYMGQFVSWACKVVPDPATNLQEKLGALTTLAMLFKVGERANLLPHCTSVLGLLASGITNDPNTLLRKLCVKLAQRLGLTLVKLRVAAWRYKQEKRSLVENLTASKEALRDEVLSRGPGIDMRELVGGDNSDESIEDIEEGAGEVEEDLPMEIEDVIEMLLNGLRDKDTIIRWSAAKGIGRVTGRLTKSYGDEVVMSVLDLFDSQDFPSSWHGGCLALAELGRRGLLLPSRLEQVIPVVSEAIVYDEMHSSFSIGAHIRDAACYVCWSFARAYEPSKLLQYVAKLATSLVTVAVFDREVNCRRAASAAFQENVGRQGTFPHGIDILTKADYYAVGNRRRAFVEISTYIAQFEEYRTPMMEHLVEKKMKHWDVAVRKLTAEAMHQFTFVAPFYMRGEILPRLLAACRSTDMNTRHCALHCVGEVVHALSLWSQPTGQPITDVLSEATLNSLREVLEYWREPKLPKSMDNVIMRQAAAHLVECCSLAKLPFGSESVEICQTIIDGNLQQVEPATRESAVAALTPFVTTYYMLPDGKPDQRRDAIVSAYFAGLKAPRDCIRCGAVLALGAFPCFMMDGHMSTILEQLRACAQIVPGEELFVESRRDAIKAITRIFHTVPIKLDATADEGTFINLFQFEETYKLFLNSLDDYTLDQRGDVGSWVREAAMLGLKDITIMAQKVSPSTLRQPLAEELFARLIQQSLEKIDHIRAVSGQVFYDLVNIDPQLMIPGRDVIEAHFSHKDVNWASEKDAIPLFVQLLCIEPFKYRAILGLTQSMGGLTERLMVQSSSAFFNYISALKSENRMDELHSICNTVVQVFRDHLNVDRITIPILVFLERLIESGHLTDVIEETTFPKDIIELTGKEVLRTQRPEKLFSAVNIYLSLVSVTEEVQKSCLKRICNLLLHRFPRIRKATADKLYEALMVDFEGQIVSPSSKERTIELLTGCQWDRPVKELKPVHSQLFSIMNLL